MGKDINVVVGRRVASLRGEMGLSQEKFAELCNVHRTYIGAIERGEKSPTLSTMEKIAKGLNVSMSKLFVDL